MNGVLVRYYGEDMWLIELLPTPDGVIGICVARGGQIHAISIDDLRVERPNEHFPLGYQFSRVQAEEVPA